MSAAKPRKARPHRVPKARMTSGPRIPSDVLTSRDRSEFICDAGGGRIGAVIATAGGFAAWSLRTKLGEFPTLVAAERAVHKANKAKWAPWEIRS